MRTVAGLLGALVAAALGVAGGCDRGAAARSDPPPAPLPTTAPDNDNAREQLRFDTERRPDRVVAALALRPGAHVADVGAGSGLLTVHLARAVAPDGKVIATDIDGAVLELLASRLTDAGLSKLVEPRVVTGDEPGLEPATYDAILLADVDNYFVDPVAWLRAARGALKPGGRLVISNRIYRRTQALAAAAKAGLVLLGEETPEPSHFLATFTAEARK
jgi:ubiquinone/menaquinone biosynthesis C-methylase UbiE